MSYNPVESGSSYSTFGGDNAVDKSHSLSHDDAYSASYVSLGGQRFEKRKVVIFAGAFAFLLFIIILAVSIEAGKSGGSGGSSGPPPEFNGWYQDRGNALKNGRATNNGPKTIDEAVAWQFIPPNEEFVLASSPIISKSGYIVYAASDSNIGNGSLFSVSPEGELAWEYPLGEDYPDIDPIIALSSPANSTERFEICVFVSPTSGLTAIEVTTGLQAWSLAQYSTQTAISVVTHGDKDLLLSYQGGSLIALFTKDIVEIPVKLWEYKYDGTGTPFPSASPAVDNRLEDAAKQ